MEELVLMKSIPSPANALKDTAAKTVVLVSIDMKSDVFTTLHVYDGLTPLK